MVRPLTRPMRWTIVLVALLLGTIVNEIGIRAARLPLMHAMPGLAAIMQLSITLTVTLAFVGSSLRQRALWVMLAGMLALVGAISYWQYSNLPDRQAWHEVLLLNGPFIALALLLYLLLPWLQSRLASGRWGDYPTLFSAFWHNSITGLVMLLAIFLGWLLMWLCTALFTLVGITWFETLFFDGDRTVGWMVSCVIAAWAVIFCRQHEGLLRSVQQLLTLIATALLPIMAVVALLFTLTLPFVGLTALSQQVSACGLLNTLCLMLLVLAALVWHPGRAVPPWPRLLRLFVRYALLVTPLFALMAAWALWQRVSLYGWTPERLWAAAITLTALVWSVGYALSLFASQRLFHCHQAFLLLAPLLLVLMNSPVLDPWRIAANSQLARFTNNPTALDDDTLRQLANGRRPGRAALQQLASLPEVQADSDLSRRIAVALHPERWRPTVYEPQHIIGRIPVVGTGLQPDADVWRALAETYKDELAACVHGGSPSPCLLLAQDVTRDGQPEWIFIRVDRFRVGVFGKSKAGRWQQIGSNYYLHDAPDARQLHEIIARGAVSAVPKPLDDLMLGDVRVELRAER